MRIAAVGADAGAYVAFLACGQSIWVSKGIALVCGSLFAYWVNKTWTFRSTRRSAGELATVLFLYLLSMGVNVSINGAILRLLDPQAGAKFVAYAIALLPSATITFVGMKLLFRQRGADSASQAEPVATHFPPSECHDRLPRCAVDAHSDPHRVRDRLGH